MHAFGKIQQAQSGKAVGYYHDDGSNAHGMQAIQLHTPAFPDLPILYRNLFHGRKR